MTTKTMSIYQAWNEGHLCGFGSFHTNLFQLYQIADQDNQKRLDTAFPEWFVDAADFFTSNRPARVTNIVINGKEVHTQ